MKKIYELEFEVNELVGKALRSRVPLSEMFEFGFNALYYNRMYIGNTAEEFEAWTFIEGLTLDTVVEIEFTDSDCDGFTGAHLKKVEG